jgi:tetrahydromethanopterin S-methyltransferase subunit B
MDDLTKLEIENIKERLNRIEKVQESFDKELKEQRTMLNEFDTTQQLILQKLDTIMNAVEELKHETAKVKEQPGKNWEKAKWGIISAIISAVVTGVIAMIVG